LELTAQARAWLEQDPDPATRAELEALLVAEADHELQDRFGSQLQFGTAGLRGALGAGPNRMNRIVVARTALAIARFLRANDGVYGDPSGSLSVVIGYDARTNSDVFARDSAAIFAAAGISTALFEYPVPTPVAAFTGRRLGASATIVVTASHNPPADNGYKVYLGGPNGGSQLVPPQDAEIAGHITEVAATMKFGEIPKSTDYRSLGAVEVEHYRDRALQLLPGPDAGNPLKISYTALHGVGWAVTEPLFKAAGFALAAVIEQRDPDPKFSTLSFPNPEEPGAMDLAFAHASAHQSDLILAHDPDADRLAVAVPADFGQGSASGWRMLTGDEVGLILGELVASRSATGALANSIVSAGLLARVAEHYGLQFEQTLTGFKWISKVPGLVYGYEEALGYCVDPEHTPDKDGITAALLIADLAARLASSGLTLADHLDELNQRYGYLATGQVSLRLSAVSDVKTLMDGLRANPPAELATEPLVVEDLLQAALATDALRIRLATSDRQLIIRPSGTEPKLKCYLQASGGTAATAASALAELEAATRALLAAHRR
jgi:phosphomannomutase